MNTIKLPVVGETTVGTVDWWFVNQIVGAGTIPLEDLKPRYFRHRGSYSPASTAVQVIDALFPNNPQLNFCENQMEWVGRREDFRGSEAGMATMSPNTYGYEDRKHIVVRFSDLISQREKIDLWREEEENLVTLAMKSQPRLPLVLVTECADVLEGWFNCDEEEILQAFFARARKMGADAVLWEKHGKVLVPGGSGVAGFKANVEFLNVEGANEQLLTHNDREKIGK
jgi:hypothetical protein